MRKRIAPPGPGMVRSTEVMPWRSGKLPLSTRASAIARASCADISSIGRSPLAMMRSSLCCASGCSLGTRLLQSFQVLRAQRHHRRLRMRDILDRLADSPGRAFQERDQRFFVQHADPLRRAGKRHAAEDLVTVEHRHAEAHDAGIELAAAFAVAFFLRRLELLPEFLP